MKKDDVLNEIESYGDISESKQDIPVSGGVGGTVGMMMGIFTLLVFIGGIIGAIHYSDIDQRISIMCVGGIFLWIGIIAVASTKLTLENLPVLLFPLVGLLMAGIPGVMLLNEKSDDFNFEITEEMIIYLCLFGFLIAGICILIVPMLIRKKKLETCTLTVEARCIDMQYRWHHSRKGRAHKVYAPKWEYMVNGQIYTHQETGYSNVGIPNIGDVEEVLVNPDDPNELYRYVKSQDLIVKVIGIMFVGVSVLSLFMYGK